MKRRLFSAILSLIMLLSLVPMTVFADTSTTYVKASTVEAGKDYLIVAKGSSHYYALSGENTKVKVNVSDNSITLDDSDAAALLWKASTARKNDYGDYEFTNAGTNHLYRSGSNVMIGAADAQSDAKYYGFGYNGEQITTGQNGYYKLNYGNSVFSFASGSSYAVLYEASTSGGGSEQPETPEGNEVYSLTNKFEIGKTYLIVSVNDGTGKALANNSSSSFATTDVTVADGKIAASSALAKAEWEAKATKSGETLIGLYNGSTVLKVDANDASNPYIKTNSTSYNAGGFGYTANGHVSYPYGNPAQDYFIGWNNDNFAASGSESGLGKVYIFVKGEAGGDVEPVTYTVTFNMNGHGAAVDAQTVTENGKAIKPADPTADGYTFDGWFADENCTTAFDFNAAITANTTVYAKWTEVVPEGDVLVMTPTTSNPTETKAIAKGASFILRLKNGGSDTYTFNVTFDKNGVATATPNSVEIAKSASKDVVITGVEDGTVTISVANTNQYSQRKATISLTVGAGDQPEAGALAEATTLEDGSVYLIVANGKAMVATDGGYYENNNGEYRYSGLASKAYANSEEDAAAITADMLWQIEVDGGKMYIKNGNQYLNATYSSSSTPKGGSVSLGAKSDSWTLSNNELKSATAGKSLEYGNNGGTASTIFAARSTGSKLTFYKFEGTLPGGDVEHIHTFSEWTVATAATCTEKGTEQRSCSACDTVETRETNALGHSYKAVVTAPTCTEGGYTTYTCERCMDSYVSESTAALNHNFGDWTFISETQHQRTCANDASHKETANHNFVNNVCADCGYTKTVVPTDITYLAFTSDVHNSNGNTSATRLNTWLNTVSGKLNNAKFADMGMCGDMANASSSESSYWSLAKTTMDTVMNNGNVTGTGFFVCGNHEWSPGNFGSTSSDQKARIKAAGSYDEKATYVLYSLGATSSSDSGTGIKSEDITALENYLKTAPTDRPIFVLSHFPLHSYGSGYGGRSTKNADAVINVLNTAAKNGHTIIFLWGHNHTMSDSNYDKVITDKIGSTNISFTYAAAGCMSDSEYSGSSTGGSASVKGKGLVATINGTNVELTYYNANGGIVASGMANVGGNGGEDPIVPTDPTGDVVYKLVNGFELGKTYLIVSVNDGEGKVLTSDLSTSDVTVTDGKVTVSNAMTRAEWKVDNSVNGRLGLYNGSKVLKVNASDANNPVITTEDAYNYGGFTYTNHHFVYPYGGGAGAETNYYFGVKNGNFVASATENGLGEVYLFEKVESGSQGGEDNPPATDKVVELTPSTDKPSKDVTIKVGESFTVALTNGSTQSAYDFNTTFSKSGIASASPSTVNIAKSATENIVITGDAVGTTTITFSNSNTYGSQYTRIATINLTVTGEGGEEPIDPPAEDDVINVTPSTSNPTESKSIEVGEKFTVRVKNGTTNNQTYTFTVSFSKDGVATADHTEVANVAANATCDFEFTGVADGNTVITISNGNGQYARKATINLTVGSGSSEEPIDPPATDKVVELTPSTDKPSQNVTIKVGETFTVALTNGSTQSAYDFTTSFSKSGIASASPSTVNIAKSATENIVITGDAVGTTTITFSNNSTYGDQYSRKATINLTVTGEGGEEPIDPPATDDVVELTPVRNNTTSVSKTIAVGESFTVALTNSSENSAYDFNTSFSKSGIASATPSTVNVAMGGTENIVITGVKAGTTTITFSNTNSYDSSYNRTATINLTVTGEGGEDPITPPAPSGDAVYVAFSSDVHNGSGSVSSADRLNGWINKVVDINGAPLDNMGFCGDMGPASGSADSFWNNAQTVMNTVESSTNVLGDGFYVCGNHEYNPGNYSHNLNATTRNYSDAGEYIETADYIFYSLGARQWDEIYSDADINAMSEFLSAHSDFNGPIFILSHFPLHSYSSGGWSWGGSTSTSGESSSVHDGNPAVGSAKIINVLNEYPNVIYLWGHNHSSSNDHYDAIYTDKINDTEINFTYAAAGCMSDSEYGQSGNVKGKGLVAAIYDDSVVLTYYGVNGNVVGTPATIEMTGSSAPAVTYTITASAGANGSISPNGAVEVKEGRSKTFTFAPDAGYEVDTVLVNGEAVSVSGNSYTMANVSADATISVSFKKIQGTAYTLATEMKAGQYILVSNGYALYNNNGKISAVPVTVSGDTVIISDSNVAGATWTFSAAAGADKSGDYVVKSGDYYFSRVSDGSGSSVAAEITKEQKNSEASGLPYYQWTYDVANGQLKHIGGQDKSATFYAYYDTSANAFYTASSEQSLKLYVVDATQPEHQHSFGDWAVAQEATCTEKGTEQRTCSCGEVETREIEALDHDVIHHDAKAATCTEAGWNAYDTCSRCDYTTYVAIDALNHDFGDWTSISETQHQRVCANDASHVETANHNFSGDTCVDCGYTKAAAGYSFSGSVKSFCDEKDTITIQLLKDGQVVYTTMVTGNDTTYAFDAVADGNYTLKATKHGHAMSQYDVIVNGEVKQNVELWLRGDVNEDGEVTDADAVYLLYNTFFGDKEYPIEQPCDFNGDGEVTDADAVYLLYYTFFGDEDYPLH